MPPPIDIVMTMSLLLMRRNGSFYDLFLFSLKKLMRSFSIASPEKLPGVTDV